MSTDSTQAKRSAARRRKLIDAAYGLFAERGYTDVSTEEIVRRDGPQPIGVQSSISVPQGSRT